MDHEKLNKALKIWQQGPQFNKDNYHSSTGFISSSFIGDFQKCEYDAVLRYAIKEKSEFNVNFAVGHLTESYIFEGDEGFEKMVERYAENALSKRGGGYLKWVNDALELAKSVTRHEQLVNLFRSEGSIYHETLQFKLHGMDCHGSLTHFK